MGVIYLIDASQNYEHSSFYASSLDAAERIAEAYVSDGYNVQISTIEPAPYGSVTIKPVELSPEYLDWYDEFSAKKLADYEQWLQLPCTHCGIPMGSRGLGLHRPPCFFSDEPFDGVNA